MIPGDINVHRRVHCVFAVSHRYVESVEAGKKVQRSCDNSALGVNGEACRLCAGYTIAKTVCRVFISSLHSSNFTSQVFSQERVQCHHKRLDMRCMFRRLLDEDGQWTLAPLSAHVVSTDLATESVLIPLKGQV